MTRTGTMQEKILRSDQIRLRPVEPEDIDFLMMMENDPDVWEVSQTLAPYSRFQIEQYVMNAPSEIGENRQLRLMIEFFGEEGQWIRVGAIDLFDYEAMHQRAGLGITVWEPFRQQGIASAALNLFIRYAFEVLLLHQLYCSISPSNTASIRLFEQAGFTRCGVRKDWLRTGKGWIDEWLFQLINNESQQR